MNKPIKMWRTPSLLTAVAVIMTVCWLAGCAKKSEPEAVSEISNTFTDKRDGKVYRTVTIGKRTWMAENLNYETSSGSWCYDDNCAKYADSAKYGRLYDWAAAKTVCPTEWHLPSRAEWDQLAAAVGGTKEYSNESDNHHWYNAGKYLKSTSGWYDNGNGTDTHGFSALPGGGRNSADGSFGNADISGNWWTATEGHSGNAYRRYMDYYNNYLREINYNNEGAFAVRCAMDWSAMGALSQKSVGDNMVKIEMVFVKGGTFNMGCTSEQGSDCHDDEKPMHSVTVSDFYIGKYEVTQNQWVQVMGGDNNLSYFKGENLPVENVNWNDAQEFILRLNAMTGKKYRLPTEAEWEYAAQGGIRVKGYKYSGSNNVNDVAWYNVNSGDKILSSSENRTVSSGDKILGSNKNRTRAVGTKAPNELGIYDMSGNVWEWVNDWYGDYSSAVPTNPSGPSSGSYRVFRGGSWNYGARYCRVSGRNGDFPGDSGHDVGFRLVLSP